MELYHWTVLAVGVVVGFVVLTTISMVITPIYNVWQQRKKGEADLAQAQAETQIVVLKAKAELAASKHYAEADLERAKGISASISEVEQKLGGPEGYLRWKFLHMLEQKGTINQIMYIPTEAGLPILEAGKRPELKLNKA